MSKSHKYLKPATAAEIRKQKQIRIGLIIAAIVLVLAILLIVVLQLSKKPEPAEETIPTTETTVPTETTEPTTEATIPEETEPQMLPEMAELYAENPDVIGWLHIEGTNIDYPVMFTPDDEEKYIRRGFDGEYSIGGVPFVDKDCSIDPESDNIIIYGHNMSNGTQFHDLLKYEDKSFWEEYPTITFKTLYEERTYEIFAAFHDHVYYKYEDVFKFYHFIDVEGEAYFEEAMSSMKSKCTYDTEIEPEYGDHFIMLVTCTYDVEDGRYVVVGRQVTQNADSNE